MTTPRKKTGSAFAAWQVSTKEVRALKAKIVGLEKQLQKYKKP